MDTMVTKTDVVLDRKELARAKREGMQRQDCIRTNKGAEANNPEGKRERTLRGPASALKRHSGCGVENEVNGSKLREAVVMTR